MMTDIETLRAELSAAIDAAHDEGAIEAVRVSALGKKGSVSALLSSLGAMSPDERKAAGPAINGLKNEVAERIEARRAALREKALEARLAAERVDATLPVTPQPTAIR
jgi:phenylalanyl-tRNA synthetase alpha chain